MSAPPVGRWAGRDSAARRVSCRRRVLLRERNISATTPTKEWEVDLEEGQQLELAVTLEDGMTVNGYVHRADTGEEVAGAGTTSGTTRQEFEVPVTGTYVVSIEVNGSTGSIRLQED